MVSDQSNAVTLLAERVDVRYCGGGYPSRIVQVICGGEQHHCTILIELSQVGCDSRATVVIDILNCRYKPGQRTNALNTG
ncbi:hypothetical protein D3C75_670160 [compost metagenome]